MRSILLLISVLGMFAITGCTGIPDSVDVNPEFRSEMEGKTLSEATGTPALWGQTEDSIAKKIFPSKTSKNEIKMIFGSTNNVKLTETAETWTYKSSVVTIFESASYTKNTLIVLFDNDGIVKRYTMVSDVKQ